MAKFHINTQSGDIGPCRATQGKCPFGGASGEENHYDSIVDAAKAYEKSMGSSFKQDWHWNKRTNQPAWCPNDGCPVGASDSEHYGSQAEASAAQESRWQALLDQKALKGKELTAAVNYAQDQKFIRHALETGTMKQGGMVLYRINSRTFWAQQNVSDEVAKQELVNAYKKLAERNMHVKNPLDFIYSSPQDPTKWEFFSRNEILTEQEIDSLFVQYPTFFFARQTDEQLELAENTRLLTWLEDGANKGRLSKEDAKDVYDSLSSSDNGSFPSFQRREYRREPGPLWDQFQKTQAALWKASQ